MDYGHPDRQARTGANGQLPRVGRRACAGRLGPIGQCPQFLFGLHEPGRCYHSDDVRSRLADGRERNARQHAGARHIWRVHHAAAFPTGQSQKPGIQLVFERMLIGTVQQRHGHADVRKRLRFGLSHGNYQAETVDDTQTSSDVHYAVAGQRTRGHCGRPGDRRRPQHAPSELQEVPQRGGEHNPAQNERRFQRSQLRQLHHRVHTRHPRNGRLARCGLVTAASAADIQLAGRRNRLRFRSATSSTSGSLRPSGLRFSHVPAASDRPAFLLPAFNVASHSANQTA